MRGIKSALAGVTLVCATGAGMAADDTAPSSVSTSRMPAPYDKPCGDLQDIETGPGAWLLADTYANDPFSQYRESLLGCMTGMHHELWTTLMYMEFSLTNRQDQLANLKQAQRTHCIFNSVGTYGPIDDARVFTATLADCTHHTIGFAHGSYYINLSALMKKGTDLGALLSRAEAMRWDAAKKPTEFRPLPAPEPLTFK